MADSSQQEQAMGSAAPEQPRVLLLFDINGVLTNRTPSKEEASYRPRKHTCRPHIEHLLKLQRRFKLGIYSSAMPHTINRALLVIESSIRQRLQEQGEDPGQLQSPLFPVVFSRSHCRPDTKWRERSGGKQWDTVKPLALHGLDLATTVLVDNDDHKAVHGEYRNMLLVPDWEDDPVSDSDFPTLMELMVERLAAAEDVREAVPSLVAEFEARRVAAHGPEAHPQLSRHYTPREGPEASASSENEAEVGELEGDGGTAAAGAAAHLQVQSGEAAGATAARVRSVADQQLVRVAQAARAQQEGMAEVAAARANRHEEEGQQQQGLSRRSRKRRAAAALAAGLALAEADAAGAQQHQEHNPHQQQQQQQQYYQQQYYHQQQHMYLYGGGMAGAGWVMPPWHQQGQGQQMQAGWLPTAAGSWGGAHWNGAHQPHQQQGPAYAAHPPMQQQAPQQHAHHNHHHHHNNQHQQQQQQGQPAGWWPPPPPQQQVVIVQVPPQVEVHGLPAAWQPYVVL